MIKLRPGPATTLRGQATGDPNAPLGLYVHIPFCAHKCPYCDFNTFAGLEDSYQGYVDALCLEIAGWRKRLEQRTLTTIFLGGGTPTVLSGSQLAQILHAVRAAFHIAPGAELTSEANPGTVDEATFADLAALGINRLSMGAQSFQANELRFLGRIHAADEVARAFGAARRAGFQNVNLDLMFGLPDQPTANWHATLDRALELGPEHLSLYSLIVEPNTPLHTWVRTGQVAAPDDDAAAELYEIAMERLESAGYVHYEVSNWALPGQPAALTPQRSPDLFLTHNPGFASRHNLLYWRNQEYLGVGPGAHSHLRERAEDGTWRSRRWSNLKSVPAYVRALRSGDPVALAPEWVTGRHAMGETMMLGLRLVQEGVGFDDFKALHAADLPEVFAEEIARLSDWGMLELRDASRLVLTPRGLMVGNQVCGEFLPELETA